MSSPHSKDLRKGRLSLAGHYYLLTIVTQKRQAFFSDFKSARTLIWEMRELCQSGACENLAWVVMPDHLHWLIKLEQHFPLNQLMKTLKARTAQKLGRPIWQAGYHDHALREDEDIRSIARYIIANPLRAGLVPRLADYPHWDAIWV